MGRERRIGSTEPEYADDGRPAPTGAPRPRPEPAPPGRGRRRLARASSARSRPGARSRRSTRSTRWRTSSGSRSTACCSWTPSRRPAPEAADAPERRPPRSTCRTIPCSAPRRDRAIRLGLGRRLGAPHHRVDPERRLPPRDLRGRRRIEPRGGVPAPLRSGVGLRPERDADGPDRLRRVRPPARRRDQLRLGARRTACSTRVTSRRPRSGSPSAGAPWTSRAAERRRSARPQRGCSQA